MMANIERLNVRRLIELLQQLPGDLPVVVHSYEDGFDPVTDIRTITVAETPDRAWYVGIYKESDGQGENAVLISSKYYCTDSEG